MSRRRYPFGRTALGLSFLALILSLVPPCLLERKLAALEQLCADNAAAFSFTCDTPSCTCESDAEKCAFELHHLRHWLHLCRLGIALAAVAAIGAALCSWQKERAKELCLSSMILAAFTLLAVCLN
ncbi:hypothetical protein [Candidatus Electronema sp. JM]|uniref:hypothetical protein n=1 Tax=Candidatus Electronema sp. JM TaxID=3401571 RepID=UPI003AA87C9A